MTRRLIQTLDLNSTNLCGPSSRPCGGCDSCLLDQTLGDDRFEVEQHGDHIWHVYLTNDGEFWRCESCYVRRTAEELCFPENGGAPRCPNCAHPMTPEGRGETPSPPEDKGGRARVLQDSKPKSKTRREKMLPRFAGWKREFGSERWE